MRRWRQIAERLAYRTEAPTWLLAVTIYSGWAALTFWWAVLPVWLVLPLGAWLCAWHMSLQHELMHGHPTRSARINTALASPPLNLWLPYPIYRDSHLRHHRADHLTDPLEDPESTYMTQVAWAGAGRLRRMVHGACNTFLGRMLLGPAFTIAGFWVRQARWAHAPAAWQVWLWHAAGSGLVLAWVVGVCRISLLSYIACFVYPGTALIMLRSLAEHRAASDPQDRTAVVERAGLLGLLYLNNNLHLLHHERPSIPWFALPAHWRDLRDEMLGARQGPVYRGYRDVALRYAVRPQHAGPHPVLRDAT